MNKFSRSLVSLCVSVCCCPFTKLPCCHVAMAPERCYHVVRSVAMLPCCQIPNFDFHVFLFQTVPLGNMARRMGFCEKTFFIGAGGAKGHWNIRFHITKTNIIIEAGGAMSRPCSCAVKSVVCHWCLVSSFVLCFVMCFVMCFVLSGRLSHN